MSESSQNVAARRFLKRPSLRTATMVVPKTGERIKRSFTLRRASNGSTAPLLGRRSEPVQQRGYRRAIQLCKEKARTAYALCTSNTGLLILKCSLAYVLGSLATFNPFLSGLLGHNDGKHMVATVTVYFHPARTQGSMIEAILLAWAAFMYATIISFSSMAVSIFFAHKHLIAVGHAIVLVVFCGGGLGLVGWTKQRLGNPLVNVACSLACLALITVLTKEGAVQAAMFSYNKIWQVLKMVIMGTTASAAVCFLIRPTSARKDLRDDLRKATGTLGTMLSAITHSFFSGSADELNHPKFIAASNHSKTIFKTLVKDLGEAKYEHYILGTEQEYQIECRLVKCLEQLTHNIGGLRSSAQTQFTLLANSEAEDGGMVGIHTRPPSGKSSHSNSPVLSPDMNHMERRISLLASIDELPESSDATDDEESANSSSSWKLPRSMQSSLTEADMFSIFIAHLGPPMKSLAYTLREILDELPYGPGPDYDMEVDGHFRSSLLDAHNLFTNARKEALHAVYKNKIPSKTGSVAVAADFEEVAASCGYFSSSLEDFAEDMVTFLDILEELKDNVCSTPRKRSWKWLKFWHRNKRTEAKDDAELSALLETEDHAHPREIHPVRRGETTGDLEKSKFQGKKPLTYRLWRAFRVFRRDDIKYALKVGIGAMIYSVWSFIPATQPIYGRWRGEWGLLSYMLVCSMTIGASNTTGFQRFFGTCIGAVFAVVAWVLSNENPWILGFLGWLVSLQCFYIIVGKGKGPMGRFIFLTYNLSCLYAYSLSVRDDEDDDDEGGISPEIWEIVLHRVVAVMSGCIWGIIVTRIIWPISARRRVKRGIWMLWLKMGLVWKRGPLRSVLRDDQDWSYMHPHEELEMRRFLTHLDGLRNSASFEFELRGPFPDQSFKKILEATGRMLDSFHAMNVVILRDLKASEGEKEILKYTQKEWVELSWRISHLFSVLASSMKLTYPLNDVLPNVEHSRDRLLAKVFEFRRTGLGKVVAKDEDYELLYAYALVTGQLAQDLNIIAQEIEQLYGVLNEDDLKLQ